MRDDEDDTWKHKISEKNMLLRSKSDKNIGQ